MLAIPLPSELVSAERSVARWRWAATAVAAAIVLDFYPAHRVPMTRCRAPPELAVVRDDPERGFGVLDLRDFAAQRRQLGQAKVKYIVIHHPQGGLYRWRDEDGPLQRYRSTYEVVADGPRLTVLRVH